MFDFKKFYSEENIKVFDSYEHTIDVIRTIISETRDDRGDVDKKEFIRFFHHGAKHILKFYELEKKLDENYYKNRNFEELNKENNGFYDELVPDNYEKSYANPQYCVAVLGEHFGQLFSFLYVALRQYIRYTQRHQIYKMEELNRLFIDSYIYVKEKGMLYEPLKEIITRVQRKKDVVNDYYYGLYERFHPEFDFYTRLIESAKSDDIRYMFQAWQPVSEYEIKTAQFIKDYPEDKIIKLAETVVSCYFKGFERKNRTIGSRKNTGIFFTLGQERLSKAIISELKNKGMKCCIPGISSTPVNRQYFYDHQFDFALFFDKELAKNRILSYKKALKKIKDQTELFSGSIYFDSFGEPPFCPVNKKENLKPGEEQQKLYKDYSNELNTLYNEYLPRTKTGFCIIAFPSPEIGENYKEIFEDIFKINTLDSDEYERIQQKIIDVLDTADFVHVKGIEGNETDIKIKMQELTDPKTQTNFENCGATVNIPVGEVFTSPTLKGTNGVLFIKEIYLRDLRFDNLKLVFKDGYITEYTCTNYPAEEENINYIKENLLFPHNTLPMGEFAIGTNTLAYKVSKKYNIINKLPILIIEKMGPHFAVGDTCFSRSEDHKVHNAIDKKEITARENEKSALRKTDPDNAYTNTHTDISLPYEEIGFIKAITHKGQEIAVISNGKFVLAGTEKLNQYLDA